MLEGGKKFKVAICCDDKIRWKKGSKSGLRFEKKEAYIDDDDAVVLKCFRQQKKCTHRMQLKERQFYSLFINIF